MRDPFFDNAKAILIILVILGHIIEPWAISDYSLILKSVYLFIYSFHMPAFVFIVGHFAKLHKVTKVTKKYLLLYIIFSFLYLPFSGRNIGINLIAPYWILWFLISIIYWHVMLEFFINFKHPMVLSLVIGIIAGYFDRIGVVASLSRILVFFPFFYAGYLTKESGTKPISKLFSLMIFGLTFLLFSIFVRKIPVAWFWGSVPYSALVSVNWYSGIYRLIIYAIFSLMTMSFLSLVPRKKTILTSLGNKTLYIYLCHGIVVKVLHYFIFQLT